MTDRVLFDLADGWTLGADSNQWTLLRRRKRQDEAYWNPVAFVGSNTRIVRRILRENGVQPNPEARAKLDALPERFLDYRHQIGTSNLPKHSTN